MVLCLLHGYDQLPRSTVPTTDPRSPPYSNMCMYSGRHVLQPALVISTYCRASRNRASMMWNTHKITSTCYSNRLSNSFFRFHFNLHAEVGIIWVPVLLPDITIFFHQVDNGGASHQEVDHGGSLCKCCRQRRCRLHRARHRRDNRIGPALTHWSTTSHSSYENDPSIALINDEVIPSPHPATCHPTTEVEEEAMVVKAEAAEVTVAVAIRTLLFF